jgi:VanZ family protein
LRAPIPLHLPTLFWALITALGLVIPGADMPRIDPDLNWVSALAHFVLCFVLAWLLYRSLSGGGRSTPSAVGVWVACFVYSGLLEVAQLWVPGRSFELADFVVNALGALGGVLWAKRFYAAV